jgi:hypothetical protein
VFTRPAPPQPRRRVHLRAAAEAELRARYGTVYPLRRDEYEVAACYDYGGCMWAGDGCKGKPVVLGPGEGCVHTCRGGLGGTIVRASGGDSIGKRNPELARLAGWEIGPHRLIATWHKPGCNKECGGACMRDYADPWG